LTNAEVLKCGVASAECGMGKDRRGDRDPGSGLFSCGLEKE
jgi:hypothetical protein